MKVACVILNYNDSIRIIKLVDLLVDYQLFDNIVVVDNNSNINEQKLINELKYSNVDVLETNSNLGFSGGNNYGLRFLSDKNIDYVFTINSDIFVEKNVLLNLIDILEKNKDIAVSSCQMIENNSEKSCYYDFPTISHYILDNLGLNKLFKVKPKHVKKVDNLIYVDYIRSSLWCVRYSDFKQIDFFDENTFLYHVETCVGLKFNKINKKMILLDDNKYFHNHIYKKGYKIKGYKDSYKSLLYIFDKYLNKNFFQIILYKFSYYLGLLIRKVLRIK